MTQKDETVAMSIVDLPARVRVPLEEHLQWLAQMRGERRCIGVHIKKLRVEYDIAIQTDEPQELHPHDPEYRSTRQASSDEDVTPWAV